MRADRPSISLSNICVTSQDQCSISDTVIISAQNTRTFITVLVGNQMNNETILSLNDYKQLSTITVQVHYILRPTKQTCRFIVS